MKIQIAQNIRKMRKQRDMMQEQLAEALGVSIAAVSKWERGVAMPDLSYIVEMADLFGVSMDVLVGYQVQSGACKDLEERIHNLQREKNFEDAALEAEKALTRYPNDFSLVYRCGEMYQLKGIETNDHYALERAIELLNHAVLLLPQNADPEISEFTIQSEIAVCYISLGKTDQGVELLKKYNFAGVHNDLIGEQYAISDDHEPEEAELYLMKAFADCFQKQVRTMTGYANYYAKLKNREAVLDVMLWLIGYLESVKSSEAVVSYVDKMRAPFYAECANQSFQLGRMEEAGGYLRKAIRIARAFDAAPVYHVQGMKFCIGDTKHATAYDDIGETAMDAIEGQLLRGGRPDELKALWEKLKDE